MTTLVKFSGKKVKEEVEKLRLRYQSKEEEARKGAKNAEKSRRGEEKTGQTLDKHQYQTKGDLY